MTIELYAAAAIITGRSGEEILAFKRADEAPDYPGHWNLPGGHMKSGEDPIDALVREVEEETALIVVRLVPLCNVRGVRFFHVFHFEGSIQLDRESTAVQWLFPGQRPNPMIPLHLDVIDFFRHQERRRKQGLPTPVRNWRAMKAGIKPANAGRER